jgi:hypothetical protein
MSLLGLLGNESARYVSTLHFLGNLLISEASSSVYIVRTMYAAMRRAD